MRVLRKAAERIRGASYAFLKKLFNARKFRGAKRLVIGRGAEIRIARGSAVCLGRGVHVGKDALVSALKGGVITVGDGASVGAGNFIVCHEEITIGKNTILAPGVMIYDHDHLYSPEAGVDKRKFKTAPVEIGDNCWICANAVILRGTKIGNNCVVGAGAVIKGEYPDGSVIIQKRETVVKELKNEL